MTYCVGILLDEGVVLASDSRTNAGIDRVSTFRKMFTFEKPGERFFALLTAGNLSLTQGVISLLGEWLEQRGPRAGSVRRDLDVRRGPRGRHKRSARSTRSTAAIFSSTRSISARRSSSRGQLKGGQLRLFMVYDAGNFIEAMGDTIYFQIGEVKYGKPILDRIIPAATRA